MARTLLAVMVSATLLSVTGPSSASCAAPSLELSGYLARPGDIVTVEGEGFSEGCDDTGESGCFGGGSLEPSAPYKHIPIEVVSKRPPKEEIQLGMVDARPNGTFEIDIKVPELPPGRYLITAGRWGIPLQVRKP